MTDEITEFPTRLNPLPAETRAEAREKREARRTFSSTFGPFVRAMRDAVSDYLGMRASGVEREDAIRGIESVLRDVWPKPATKYGPACLTCDDIGYEELVCRFGHWCQRERCRGRGPEWEHRYVVPCSCEKGDRFRPKYRSEADAVASVAKVARPKRGWSRPGF